MTATACRAWTRARRFRYTFATWQRHCSEWFNITMLTPIRSDTKLSFVILVDTSILPRPLCASLTALCLLLQVFDKPSSFHCGQTPPISIRAYVQRIAKHSKCSPVCFIMAWSYMKRISQVRLPPLYFPGLCDSKTWPTHFMLAG